MSLSADVIVIVRCRRTKRGGRDKVGHRQTPFPLYDNENGVWRRWLNPCATRNEDRSTEIDAATSAQCAYDHKPAPLRRVVAALPHFAHRAVPEATRVGVERREIVVEPIDRVRDACDPAEGFALTQLKKHERRDERVAGHAAEGTFGQIRSDFCSLAEDAKPRSTAMPCRRRRSGRGRTGRSS